MSAPTSLAEALKTYEAVIGLEVHAQLKTKSKLFCDAPNQYDPERPNHFVNQYCLGLPGVLPVLNEKVVELAIKAGLALNCEIRTYSEWSRKQYFYPDLPKGYQISQFDKPICEHGYLDVPAKDGEKRVSIERIHIEEDAGKSSHVQGANYSLVDYNRAGVPLVEIVSAPDLRSAQEASGYLKTLRAILRTLDVCDGNMEEGSFRCDANVSIRSRGETKLGTRCELKNINSFRFVEQAIEFEILRHATVLSTGGEIHQETRLFDSAKKETRSMRSKEEAHDYRYFPCPDLPPLRIEQDEIDDIKESLPELPEQKRKRYLSDYALPAEHAAVFAEEAAVANYFDAAVKGNEKQAVGIANLIKGEVLRELKDNPEAISESKLSAEDLGKLALYKEKGKISSSQQKKLFAKIWKDGTPLAELMKKEGEQLGDASVLEPILDEILAKAPKEVDKYRQGNKKVASFFVGQVMKATKGKANPAVVNQLLAKKLGAQ